MDSLATYRAGIAFGDMHLLGALTMSRDNLSDDDDISGEYDDERYEITQTPVDPVPNIDKEMFEVARHDTRCRFAAADRIDDVTGEEEMHVGAE